MDVTDEQNPVPDGPDRETEDEQTTTQSALSRAAEEGPLPGISDDAEDSDEPVGRRPHDEAKEVTGFNGAGR